MSTARAAALLLQLLLLLSILPIVLGALSAGVSSAADDPGILLEVDRARYELSTRDVGNGEPGPAFRVVLGSPAHATPPGDYSIGRVVLNPAWHPSAEALAAGAAPLGPSLDGPMGVAKIPFAEVGSIALHGGGDLLLLGKPISGGCVRARDADLLRVLAWLLKQDALGRPTVSDDGQVYRDFTRPVKLRIH